MMCMLLFHLCSVWGPWVRILSGWIYPDTKCQLLLQEWRQGKEKQGRGSNSSKLRLQSALLFSALQVCMSPIPSEFCRVKCPSGLFTPAGLGTEAPSVLKIYYIASLYLLSSKNVSVIVFYLLFPVFHAFCSYDCILIIFFFTFEVGFKRERIKIHVVSMPHLMKTLEIILITQISL